MPKQRPLEVRIAEAEAKVSLLKQQQRVQREMDRLREARKNLPRRRRRRAN